MIYNESGIVITDSKSMADIIQDQFWSVFSDPDNPDVKEPDFEHPHISSLMSEDEFTITGDIILHAIIVRYPMIHRLALMGFQ